VRARRVRLVSEGGFRLSLLAILILSALPFGSTEDTWRWLLVTALGLLFSLFLWSGAPLVLGPRERLGLKLGCAYLLWLGFQMLPMPPAVIAWLSPEAHHLYQEALPQAGGADPIGYAYPDPGALAAADSARTARWIHPALASMRTISLYPYATYRNFFQTAVLLGVMVMGLSLFRDRRHQVWLAAAVVTLAVFEAGYGVLEALTGHQHIFWYAKRFYTDSATGTLVNRNHYAALLNMALPLMVVLLLDRRFREEEPRAFSGAWRRLARAAAPFREPLLLSIVLLTGIAVVLSRSRMGLAATLAGLVSLSMLLAWLGRSAMVPGFQHTALPRSRLMWAFPPLLFVGICLYSLGMDPLPTVERFLHVGGDLNAGAMRPALWGETLPVIRSFLLTGAGSGAYPHAVNPALTHSPLFDLWDFDHAHNDYLETLATLGLAGTLLGVAAIGAFAVRRPASLLGAAALAGLATLAAHSVVDFPLVIPANALMACALLCLVAGPQAQAPAPPHVRRASQGRRRALAGALALAAVVLWPGRAAVAGVAAYVQQAAPRSPVAVPALRLAAILDPWNDQHVRHLARALPDRSLTEDAPGVVLGGELSSQALRLRLDDLAARVERHRQLLRCLDRSPIDFTLHAEIARSASAIRTLARECGLVPPDDRIGSMSPHRASLALAPTAWENHAAMAALLWRDRGEIGEPAASLAIDLLRGLRDHDRLGPQWRMELVHMTDDPASLARLDEAASPYPDAYDDLVSPQAWDASPLRASCAVALRRNSSLREARTLIDQAGRNPEYRSRLGDMRGMLQGVISSTAVQVTAESDATCGGVLHTGADVEEARQLLASLERKLAEPS
jgi:O-antigen ligase